LEPVLIYFKIVTEVIYTFTIEVKSNYANPELSV